MQQISPCPTTDPPSLFVWPHYGAVYMRRRRIPRSTPPIAVDNGSAADFRPEVTSRLEITSTFFFLASVAGLRDLGKTVPPQTRFGNVWTMTEPDQEAQVISRWITVQLPISGWKLLLPFPSLHRWLAFKISARRAASTRFCNA